MADGRLRIEITGDSKDLVAAAVEASAAIHGVGASAEQESKHVRSSADAHDRQAKSVRGSTGEFNKLDKALGRVAVTGVAAKTVISAVKLPAMVAGAGVAAQGITQLAESLTAVAAAAAPASGALVAYPAVLGAIGQGMGVVKLATSDLTKAYGGNAQALKRLTPEGRSFLKLLKDYKPQVDGLRSAVQKGLFPGLESSLKRIGPAFRVVRRELPETAKVMGHLADNSARMVAGWARSGDLAKIMGGNTRTLGDLGKTVMRIADALRHVMVAADPFVKWMTGSVAHLALLADNAARAGRETGKLGTFFDHARQSMTVLGHIATNLAATILHIGTAGRDSGMRLLEMFDRTTRRWATWTASFHGQNVIRQYFKNAEPGFIEFSRLIGDVGKSLAVIGNQPGMDKLIRQLRTEALPALTSILIQSNRALGPALLDSITSVLKLFNSLSYGPLRLVVEAIGTTARALNALLDSFGPFKSDIAFIIALGGMGKILKVGAALTGVKSIYNLLRGIATMKAEGGLLKFLASRVGLGAAAGGLGTAAARGTTAAGTGAGTRLVASRLVGGAGTTAAIETGAGAAGIGALPAAGIAAAAAGLVATWYAADKLTKKMKESHSGIVSTLGDVELFGQRAQRAIMTGGMSEALDRLGIGFDSTRKKIHATAAMSGQDLARLREDMLRFTNSQAAATRAGRFGASMGQMFARTGVTGASLSTMLRGMDQLPAQMRQKAAASMVAYAKGLEEKKQLPAGTAERLRKLLVGTYQNIRIASVAEAKKLADQTHDQVNRIRQAFQDVKVSDFATKWAKGLQRAGDVTPDVVRGMLRDFDKLPPGLRTRAGQAIMAITRRLVADKQLPAGAAKKVGDAISAALGVALKPASAHAWQVRRDVQGALSATLSDTSTALASLTGKGLRNVVKAPFSKGAGTPGGIFGAPKAEGGWIGAPGQAGRDTVPALVGAGEAVVNRHQQPYIEHAMAVAHAVGESPYSSMNALFSGEDRPHYLAKGGFIRRFASGGGPERGRGAQQQRAKRAGQRAGGPGTWRYLDGDLDFLITLGDRLEAMAEGTHTHIHVQEGRRTLAEQQARWNAYKAGTGNLAAFPSPNAPHVRGVAADITPGRGTFGGVAGRYGLAFTVPSEDWHIALTGSGGGGGFGPGGAGKVKMPHIRTRHIGEGGALGAIGNAELAQAARGGNQKLHAMARKLGIGFFASGKKPAKGWAKNVQASYFGSGYGKSDPGTGHQGYKGDDLRRVKWAYAELGMGHLLGGLPYRHKLLISTLDGKKRAVAGKYDIGAGGPNHPVIDLWNYLANYLGFLNTGIGQIRIGSVDQHAPLGPYKGPKGKKKGTSTTRTAHTLIRQPRTFQASKSEFWHGLWGSGAGHRTGRAIGRISGEVYKSVLEGLAVPSEDMPTTETVYRALGGFARGKPATRPPKARGRPTRQPTTHVGLPRHPSPKGPARGVAPRPKPLALRGPALLTEDQRYREATDTISRLMALPIGNAALGAKSNYVGRLKRQLDAMKGLQTTVRVHDYANAIRRRIAAGGVKGARERDLMRRIGETKLSAGGALYLINDSINAKIMAPGDRAQDAVQYIDWVEGELPTMLMAAGTPDDDMLDAAGNPVVGPDGKKVRSPGQRAMDKFYSDNIANLGKRVASVRGMLAWARRQPDKQIRDMAVPLLSAQIGPGPDSLLTEITHLQAALNERTGIPGYTAPDTGAGAADAGTNWAQRLADLQQQSNDMLKRQNAMIGAQLTALQGFAPLAGGRYVGAFAAGGPIVQTGYAMVHRGEYIVPSQDGPHRPATVHHPGPTNVTVYIEGDVGALVGRIRAEVDGRAARVVAEQQGRRTRVLAGAGIASRGIRGVG